MEMDGIMAIDKLKDHYKHCIRLSASNKINPKNAFDLQLIDYMQDLVNSTEDGQMNFKIASSALDVGAKIYSNRVDYIQSEAQKVASSILMALDDQQNKDKNSDNLDDTQAEGDTTANSDGLNDSRESNEAAQTKANKRKRATRNKNVKTVVEDENLLDAKLEKTVLGDAFLDSLSQDYDMSCPAALICYNALTQPNCLLTIESSHARKDYREPSTAKQQPDVRPVELAAIAEEDEDEDKDKVKKQDVEEEIPTKKTKEPGSSRNDEDGDCDMKDSENDETIEDKTTAPSTTASTTTSATINATTATTNSTVHTQASSNFTNITSEQFNLVTLITKNVNCAQIIRNNLNNRICPRLDSFLFNDRTTSISGIDTNLDESRLLDNHFPNAPNSSKLIGGAHQFDPQLYDDDAGNDDLGGDDHFVDAESVLGDGENRPTSRGSDLIPNLDKIAASRPTDYGYTNEHHRLINTWAGPHAWKVAKVPQSARKEAPKSARKRVKLEQKPIDFEENFLPGLEELADKDIRHSADVIRRWKKPLLPQDHNLNDDKIRSTMMHTFLRPEDTYHCEKSPADALKLVDKDHDYTNTGRNEDEFFDAPSPGLGGFDDVHDDSDDEFRADPVVAGNEVAIFGAPINNTLNQQVDLEFAGEHLIEQPYTVAQVNIPFAKIAKKMDVRKLKRVMWDLLLPPEKRLEMTMQADVTVLDKNADQPEEEKLGEEDNNTTLMGGDELNNTVIMNGALAAEPTKKTPSPTPSESAVHLQFSNLYTELPVRVSSKMANDLSQSIAFVTLLHLANEKNLKLIPEQDLKDFIIEQDEMV